MWEDGELTETTNENIEVNEDLVKATIEKIRPYIQFDGGDIQFVKVVDGYVYLRMYGACVGCVAIDQTLDNGVAALLQDEVPGVKGVLLVDPFEPEE